ncbi:MAG: T9SS type A sorting domain-containing protein [Bacteroidales bacterium]|nr:T9SS type A sorting domain-containing protein [Bacteroidales bacterium]
MKKSFILTVVLTLSVVLQAQRFEWVKAYSSPGGSSDPEIPSNIIKGSVVDRDGNIYVLGEYFPSATAMPFGVYPVPTDMGVSLTTANRSIVIAKLNPDGELLWYKGLHSVRSGNTGDGNLYSHGIRLIGDTAVMVCAYVQFPFENYNHDELWYLDTLLVDQYQHWGEITTDANWVSCFMTFSLDGRLIEDHIVETCAADENGEPISLYTGYIHTYQIPVQMFDVDSEGNIYTLCYVDQDFARRPNTAKLGYIIDKRRVYYRDTLSSGTWNREIVKFSPHFDTVLKVVQLFDSTSSGVVSVITETSFRFDRDNNLYLSLSQEGGRSRFPLGNSDTLFFTYNSQFDYGNCFLIKYDTALVPQLAKQTHSSPQSGTSRRGFHSRTVEFDYSTNSLYWTGWSSKRAVADLDGNADISFFYDDDTLDLDNNFFWLRLDRDNVSLISYGKARSDIATLGLTRDEDPRIVVANGKVAAMFNYKQEVSFADTTISQTGLDGNGAYSTYTALGIWDEDGNELAMHDLNAQGSYNRPGAVYAHDSILYITCSLTGSATFGDIEVPSTGRSQAILAKYVNPIFSTGGTHDPGTDPDPDPGTEGIDHQFSTLNSQISIYPNPTTGQLHINTAGQPITAITIHNTMGQQVTGHRSQVTDHLTIDLSPLPAGVYYMTVKSGDTTTRHKVIKAN